MRRASTTAAVLLALGAVAAPAAAHPDGMPAPPDRGPAHRGQLDLGPWFAGIIIDDYSGLTIGSRVALGRRHDRWLIGGEAELADVFLTQRDGDALPRSIEGVLGRIAATASWRFGRVGSSQVEVDFWLLGGVGAKMIRWWDGGVLTRPDGQVGIGLSEVFGRQRRFSLEAGVMLIMGRGVGRGAPTCAGPCDQATPPVAMDFEIVDHCAFGMRW